MNSVKHMDHMDGEQRIKQLADEVRQAAYEAAEALWSAVLECADIETARSISQALHLLMGAGGADKALAMAEGLYTLCSMDVPPALTACQRIPALVRMFMGEFLSETDEYLDDREIGTLLLLSESAGDAKP